MPKRGTGRLYPGVMVSSSFDDLVQHREAVRTAINANDMKPLAMEDDSAKADVDVIGSSLRMVEECEAYCGVIGHRYGQIPSCPTRNPDDLSLTQLEFNLARQLDKPILLFVMGDDHPITKRDVETDPVKAEKLDAFRADAKRMTEDSDVERVYAVFESYEELRVQATQAIADLRALLEGPDDGPAETPLVMPVGRTTPIAAPDLWALPRYAGSHRFVGRAAELDQLDDWAGEADPHPLLLFEAIGGTGKSMLTWHWLNERAPAVRHGWAGRLWYSFYERGADMADFLRYAVAYTTGQQVDAVGGMSQADLVEELTAQLQTRPWLLVLDGLERILVAYHRLDAAHMRDEQAGVDDAVAERDVRAAIWPEDDELLRRLTAVAPSKVLVTSRLAPRTLLTPSGQPVVGVRQQPLQGLRPPDAEALLRSCDVEGTSPVIQRYLQEHCDCHPLVIGVLAGLVHDYLPARGVFDEWAADPQHGGHLDLARLDLVQKRNHILLSAIEALGPSSRELLSTLALLSDAADLELLEALNPHAGDDAGRLLAETVHDLEDRGLLQYDRTTSTYELHPVVRGVTFGAIADNERWSLGQRVVDHFTAAQHTPYDTATSLDDLRIPINLFRVHVQLGQHARAYRIFTDDLWVPLKHNVQGAATVLALLRSLFPEGWTRRPAIPESDAYWILTAISTSLKALGDPEGALEVNLRDVEMSLPRLPVNVATALSNLAETLNRLARLGASHRITQLLEPVTDGEGIPGRVAIITRHSQLTYLLCVGAEAERFSALMTQIDEAAAMAGPSRAGSRAWMWERGEREVSLVRIAYHLGMLDEAALRHAEQVAEHFNSMIDLITVRQLRAEWLARAENGAGAERELTRVIAMLRSGGAPTAHFETWLLLARADQGRPVDEASVERLVAAQNPNHEALARLFIRSGDGSRAARHARSAYATAWADGEPHVFRFHLEQARMLLEELGEPIPQLAPYDPDAHPPFPWEAEVRERYAPQAEAD